MKSVKFLLLTGLLFMLNPLSTYAVAPNVNGTTITSTPLGGGGTFYDSGETITFQVSLDGAAGITGGGNPRLVVEIAGSDYFADYSSGSGSANLNFDLTVGLGMNDANGVGAKSIDLTNGGLTDSGSGDPMTVLEADFIDINIAGVNIDNDTPVLGSVALTSSDGNLSGGTRYLNASHSATVTVNLGSADTRGTTSATLSQGGVLNFTASGGSAGTTSSYQRTTTANFFAGQNGSLEVTNLDFEDQASKSLITPLLVAATPDPIVIDTTDPIVTFSDDVVAGPVMSDDITITVVDTNPDTTTYEYGFSGDPICNGTDTYGNAFTSGLPFTINTETNNDDYICVKVKDLAENEVFAVSANNLNIDITDPSINTTVQVSSNANVAFAKASDTVTYTITFSENVTATINNASTAANASTLTTEVDVAAASTDSLVFTVQAGDDGVIVPTVDFDIQDTAGNTVTINSLGVITGGSVTNTITADTTVPTLNPVTIISDNTNADWAKTGDEITVNFTGSETLISVTGTISTEVSALLNTAGNNWTSKLTTSGNEAEGLVPFSVDFTDLAGNIGVSVTATTDASSVTFDKTAPTLPLVSIASNNALDTTLAKTSDTITVTFTVADNLSTNAFIATPAPTILTNSAVDNVTTVAVGQTIARLTTGVETSEVIVPFSFKVKDSAGNESVVVSATTDASEVKFDRTDPVLRRVKLSAVSADLTAYMGDSVLPNPVYYAKQGDRLKLILQICDYVDSSNNPPTGTFFGQAVTLTDRGLVGAPGNCTTGAGNASQWRKWRALIDPANGTEGFVTFDIDPKDNAGNILVPGVSVTTNNSKIIFDKTNPNVPTDMVDLGGPATAGYKPQQDAASYTWSNDNDPLGGVPISGVRKFDIRYNNPNTGINEMVTIIEPTRIFMPTAMIPDVDAYTVNMKVWDKAGNDSGEQVVYTQKYGITVKGTVAEEGSNQPLEGTIVNIIAKAGEECNTARETCSAFTDNNGYYEIVVAPTHDYLVDFLKTPNHYLAKEEITVVVNDVVIDAALKVADEQDSQTGQQTITVITDKPLAPPSSGSNNFPTEIYVDSLSGEAQVTENGGKIIITSFGRIAQVTSNNPDVIITFVGNNTYEVTNAGSVQETVDQGTQSNSVSTSFESGNTRSGTQRIEGGVSNSFNGIRREDRLTVGVGISYRDSLAHARRMNEGADYKIAQYVNRNGYVVFGGYRSGTLGLNRFKRFSARDHVMFRGRKTSYQRQEFAHGENMKPQQEFVKNLFKKEAAGALVVSEEGVVAKAAEQRVTTIKDKKVKQMPGYGKKIDPIQTEITRRQYKKHHFNPYVRNPKPNTTRKPSRIKPKSTQNMILRVGRGKRIALSSVMNKTGRNTKTLIVKNTEQAEKTQ